MAGADVFLFPSRAEGSARVVFEALAAGLYVVTTPNAGSVVEEDVHGSLVAPGDPVALGNALRRAAADRGRVDRIGRSNGEMVRASYTQSAYGAGLLEIYRRVTQGASARRLPALAGSERP